MHSLEYILLITSVAVEHGEISTTELAGLLHTLASEAACYIPDTPARDEPAVIQGIGREWHRRFDHLMNPTGFA